MMQESLRCLECRQSRGVHKAGTLECPSGRKSRIGYIAYGPTKYKAPEPAKMTVTPGIYGGIRGNQRTKDARIRELIACFEGLGSSNHSANATMLQPLIEHCEAKGYAYYVANCAGRGWFIQKFDMAKEYPKLVPFPEDLVSFSAHRTDETEEIPN